jgi:hypothetical protein
MDVQRHADCCFPRGKEMFEEMGGLLTVQRGNRRRQAPAAEPCQKVGGNVIPSSKIVDGEPPSDRMGRVVVRPVKGAQDDPQVRIRNKNNDRNQAPAGRGFVARG